LRPIIVEISELLAWAMFANGPAWIRHGWPSFGACHGGLTTFSSIL